MFSQDQEQGWIGEIWAYQQLLKRGWPVHRMPDFQHQGYDMKIGDLPIEVKVARTTYRLRQRQGVQIRKPRWQWFIHNTSHALDHQDWLLILIAQDDQANLFPYIMPGNLLDGRNHLQLTSHPDQYHGWLNDWRDEWGVIAFLTQKSYLNDGPTYHQWKATQARIRA